MISRVLSRTFILLALLATASAHAQEPIAAPTEGQTGEPNVTTAPAASTVPDAARSKEERNQMEQRAKDLKQHAAKIKSEAATRRETTDKECWKKFLVSQCLEDSRIAERDENIIARQMERDARLLERNVKRFDSAEKAALREADNAKKDAEIAKKEAKRKQ